MDVSRPPKVRIGMIAGEASGDLLGAGLIRELKQRFPNAEFEGVGGPQMIAEGFRTLYPMERLSVMGLVEVLGRLPELFVMRRHLVQHFVATPPDIFIGIDSPDFTIGVELRLKLQGIKTVHYVSPSVWAWRQNRIFKIARSIDLMLTLLPFEARFYEEHQVPVQFVGHPLAEMMPINPDQSEARSRLGLAQDQSILAVLPGSRGGEVKMLGPTFIATMQWLHKRRPELLFVIPAANAMRRRQIEAQLEEADAGRLPVTVLDGHSRDTMMAANAILMASGTATLEAMLAKRPMVVAYKLTPLSYWIMKRLLKAKYVSLPNLLADAALVPELIQHQANPIKLGQAVLESLEPRRQKELQEKFTELHLQIKQNANVVAANAIVELIAPST